MDTWAGNSYDPITLHKYLYANVDPVNMVDPTGNFSILSITTNLNISSTLRAYNYASFAFDLSKGFATGGAGGAATVVAEEIVFGKLSKFRPIAKMSDSLVGLFSKLWSRGIKLKLGKPYKSSVLKHNMEQLLGELPPGHAAHHIVPNTSPAMAILKRHNIDPNSVSNGVALPRKKGTGSISAEHGGRHCKKYYDYVDRILLGAGPEKVDVINGLSLIRQELLSGSVLLQGCT